MTLQIRLQLCLKSEREQGDSSFPNVQRSSTIFEKMKVKDLNKLFQVPAVHNTQRKQCETNAGALLSFIFSCQIDQKEKAQDNPKQGTRLTEYIMYSEHH